MKQRIEKAKQQDKQAIESLIAYHTPKLTAAALSYTKSYEDAQDIVQETYMKAFQSLHQLKEPDYFSTWLYKIMIRECFAALRKKKRTLETTLALEQLQALPHEPSPTYDDLYEALQTLKPDYQTVILLHYFYDFPLVEIAALQKKPLNTIKTQLHRARQQLKKLLHASPINKQDVKTMLTQQLKAAAAQFFTIPASYELCIEDINDEGYYIEFDKQGKLLTLTQPATKHGEVKSASELQQIAAQFLTAQYPNALHYLTQTNAHKQDDRHCFKFEQLVGGLPLNQYYCLIDVTQHGQVVDFRFRGYTEQPPCIPEQLAQKEEMVATLINASWHTRLRYLTPDSYNVPRAGLYVLYESAVLHESFEAETGTPRFEHEEREEEVYVSLPAICASTPKTTEEMIGVTSSMEVIRQSNIDEDEHGIVWRDKAYKEANDKTMDSFFAARFEQTVKATFQTSTGHLKGFIWFKERNGTLDLSFEACRDIAVSFLKTYYPAYVPYVQMQVEKPSFNEAHRAFFAFPIVVDGYALAGEMFNIAINRTTGNIDVLMTPKLELDVIQSYNVAPLLPLTEAKKSLQHVDTLLAWHTDYKQEEQVEKLSYTFADQETQQSIRGIDAVTGALILSKY